MYVGAVLTLPHLLAGMGGAREICRFRFRPLMATTETCRQGWIRKTRRRRGRWQGDDDEKKQDTDKQTKCLLPEDLKYKSVEDWHQAVYTNLDAIHNMLAMSQ
jgi:hypothetical protein